MIKKVSKYCKKARRKEMNKKLSKIVTEEKNEKGKSPSCLFDHSLR